MSHQLLARPRTFHLALVNKPEGRQRNKWQKVRTDEGKEMVVENLGQNRKGNFNKGEPLSYDCRANRRKIRKKFFYIVCHMVFFYSVRISGQFYFKLSY